MKDQRWYQLYEAAVLELDSEHLTERIGAARAAIDERLADVPPGPEHQMLLEAIGTLESLRRNELK